MPESADDAGVGRRLHELELEQAETVSERDWDSVVHGVDPTPGHHWVVAVDEVGAPVAAAVRGNETAAPLVIVAHADLPTAAALDSPAFDEADADTAVVVVRASTVLGVLSGSHLVRSLTLSGMRQALAPGSLPGYPKIPYIVRPCQYADSEGVVCGKKENFPRKPLTMPRCPNPNGLPPHDFKW